jgi:hypothetical protein
MTAPSFAMAACSSFAPLFPGRCWPHLATVHSLVLHLDVPDVKLGLTKSSKARSGND